MRCAVFLKASLHSSRQPSACCELSLLKEESVPVSPREACGVHRHLKQGFLHRKPIYNALFVHFDVLLLFIIGFYEALQLES